MRCAHCKGRHDTVAEVRDCSGVQMPERTCAGMGTPKPAWPPSDAQIGYVIGLQTERTLPDEYIHKTEDGLRLMEKDEVSRLIGELKKLPYKDPKGRGQSSITVPAGRYALLVSVHHPEPGVSADVATGSTEQVWRFYQVDEGKGRWAGYTFVKQLIGAPGSYRQQSLNAATRQNVLERINEDVQKAMLDYGLQSGVCGRCSSPLTNAESLARGIGPICAGKLGW